MKPVNFPPLIITKELPTELLWSPPPNTLCREPPLTVTLVDSNFSSLSWLPPNTDVSAGTAFSPPSHLINAPSWPSVLASTVTGVPLAKKALTDSS